MGNRPLLFDGNGYNEPIINETEIWFNGDADNDLNHETFYFNIESGLVEFDFCKTERKPYDLMVCLSLLSLFNNLDGFIFSTDGKLKDWSPIIEFYKQHSLTPIKDISNIIKNPSN